MGKIEVSVYCLAYNHEKYIRKALDGFISQKTSFEYEVFVHDDASTDNTASIIKEYADKYPNIIKPIFQIENQYSRGQKIVKNIILPKMHGKYVAICEGDDYWTDSAKLQRQYDALESHPECSISTHRTGCCNEDGSYNERIIPCINIGLDENIVLSQDEFAHYIWQKGYIFHTSSYFIRREVFDIPLDLARDEGLIRKSLIMGGVFYYSDIMSMRRLWTVGNFNSRLKSEGFAGRMRLLLSNMDNDIKVNEYTEGKYDYLILPSLFMSVLYWGWYNPQYAKEYIAEHCLYLHRVWRFLSIKQKVKGTIKYVLLYVFPKGLEKYYMTRNKQTSAG